jgi:hypothetical protein
MSAKLGLFVTVLKQLPTNIAMTFITLGASERKDLGGK